MSGSAKGLSGSLAPASPPTWDAVQHGVRRRRRTRRALGIAVPALTLAAFVVWRPTPHAGPSQAAVTAAPTPRERWLSAGDTVFVDRSRVTVVPSARLVQTVFDDRRAEFNLLSGSASWEVVPGGARVWRVNAGRVWITVLGTGFRVTREGDRVEVAVRHGAVRVHDPRETVLRGGEHGVWGEPSHDLRPAAPLDGGAVSRDATAVDVSPAPALLPVRLRRDAGMGSDIPLAPLILDAGSTPMPDAAAEALWRTADTLRRAGDLRGASTPLGELVTRHPGSPRAAMAAFLLARDQLHALRDPVNAARWYQRALALGLPQALREDAWLGLAEARLRADDRAGAHEAAAAYRAQYPRGQHLDYLDALLRAVP
jgi:hypothetical protein